MGRAPYTSAKEGGGRSFKHLTTVEHPCSVYVSLPTNSLKYWTVLMAPNTLNSKRHHECGVASERGPISRLRHPSIKCNAKFSYSQICIALDAVFLNT